MAKAINDNQFHLDVLGKAFNIWTQFCDAENIALCTFEEFLEGWRFHEPNMVSGRAGDDTVSIFWRPDGPVVQIADTLQVRIWRPGAAAEQEHNEKLDLFGLMRRLLDEVQKQNVQLSLMSERIDNMALDFTGVQTALAGLQTTAQQNSTDITAILAKLAGITPADPADQAKLDAVATSLTAIKASADASDASIEAVLAAAVQPGAIGNQPAPTTTPAPTA